MKRILMLAPLALLALAACGWNSGDATDPGAPVSANPAAPYSVTNGQATMGSSGDTEQLESGAGPAGVAPNPGSSSAR